MVLACSGVGPAVASGAPSRAIRLRSLLVTNRSRGRRPTASPRRQPSQRPLTKASAQVLRTIAIARWTQRSAPIPIRRPAWSTASLSHGLAGNGNAATPASRAKRRPIAPTSKARAPVALSARNASPTKTPARPGSASTSARFPGPTAPPSMSATAMFIALTAAARRSSAPRTTSSRMPSPRSMRWTRPAASSIPRR